MKIVKMSVLLLLISILVVSCSKSEILEQEKESSNLYLRIKIQEENKEEFSKIVIIKLNK